jgi:hypothetical protein
MMPLPEVDDDDELDEDDKVDDVTSPHCADKNNPRQFVIRIPELDSLMHIRKYPSLGAHGDVPSQMAHEPHGCP